MILLEKTTGSRARLYFTQHLNSLLAIPASKVELRPKRLFGALYKVLGFIYVANCISLELHVSEVGLGIHVPVKGLQSGPGLILPS